MAQISLEGVSATRRRALLLAFLVALPLPAMGQGPWVKLSDGQSFSDVLGEVSGYGVGEISPLGDRVIYRHDADVDNAFELWSVPLAGGTPVRLSGLLPSGSEVGLFRFTPDGSRVVYTAPQDTLGLAELYAVPAAGGTPLKLSGTTVSDPAFHGVNDFQITADGSRVVFQAHQAEQQIYSVPITGGVPVRLNGDLAPGLPGGVHPWSLTPDGSQVVYVADQEADNVFEVFSVPVTGGSAIKLNPTLVAGGDVWRQVSSNSYPQISPDGSTVVYPADQDTNGVIELYSVPITGGTAIKLEGAMSNGGPIPFLISPDSSRVVYMVGTGGPSGVWELYSVPITGGTAVKLTGAVVAGGFGVGGSDWFRISADNSRVVYRAEQQTIDVIELYSVPITGGAAVKLNGPLVAGGNVLDFKLNPHNDWVVYRADQLLPGIPVGFRVPLAGPAGSGERIWQNPLVTHFDRYQIGPGGRSLVLLGPRACCDSVDRLWRVPLTGIPDHGGVELVPKAVLDPAGNVRAFSAGPHGSIAYVADQDTDDVFELYAIPALIFSDGFE